MQLEAHKGAVYAVLPIIGDRLLSASSDDTLILWDLKEAKVIRTLVGHSHTVISLAAYDSDHAISCSFDTTVKLWNVNTGRCVRTFVGHLNHVYQVRVRGIQIISASIDMTTRMWNTIEPSDVVPADGSPIIFDERITESRKCIVIPQPGEITAVRPLRNGQIATVSCGNDRALRIWEPPKVLSGEMGAGGAGGGADTTSAAKRTRSER
jgi:WD40 repeat protein